MDPLTGSSSGAGVVRIHPGEPAWPRRLDHLSDPPGELWALGDPEILRRPCVTIVGSRRATTYGRRVARDLAREAVAAGWTVLSGMALGIDGAAHVGALDAQGFTVAVLGSGPDVPSPRRHADLHGQIVRRGLILSEYPPGTGARPWHFPARNRILAALAHRVVVVEAALKSGALITAALANESGRDVWAVPGSIYGEGSRGTHRLLEDGAIPVTSLESWRASLAPDSFLAPGEFAPPVASGSGPVESGPPPRSAAGRARSGKVGAAPRAGEETQGSLEPVFQGVAGAVWSLLALEPRTGDGLAQALAVPAPELFRTLARMELDGWIERDGTLRFHRRVA